MAKAKCEKCGKTKIEDARCPICGGGLIKQGKHAGCLTCNRDVGEVCTGQHVGCYIATCVYGSYDCPEVWVLRRYRDSRLSASLFGRQFIQIYYAVSPKLVALFGKKKWFTGVWKPILNKIISKLQISENKENVNEINCRI